MRRWIAVGCLLIAGNSPGQGPAVYEFPADAKALAEEALRQRVDGKTFSFDAADGSHYNFSLASDGLSFAAISLIGEHSPHRSHSKWRVKDSSVCLRSTQDTNEVCFAVRDMGGDLLWGRQSGEVVKLKQE
jgi:hypothetical protein